MTPTVLAAVISGSGVILSGFVSAFIAGSRWGSVRQQISGLETTQAAAATKNDLNDMNLRLARIEGMFELRLRDGAA